MTAEAPTALDRTLGSPAPECPRTAGAPSQGRVQMILVYEVGSTPSRHRHSEMTSLEDLLHLGFRSPFDWALTEQSFIGLQRLK